MFTKAIVRAPAANYAEGLTTMDLGPPNYERALQQHEAYCRALERCGLTLTYLEPDDRFPDSTFVEDTALLTSNGAILTRPGAASRRGEVAAISAILHRLFAKLHTIQEPGTLDAGDVCEVEREAGSHFFIGISQRTNVEGAHQMAAWLASRGFASSFVDIRNVENILHLKGGLAYLGDNRLVVIDSLADRKEFRRYDLVRVIAGEEYAANCVRVNDHVLIAAGCPDLELRLRQLGYLTMAIEMSEFEKMDGGLSCLSLRF
jgi:dimethylargininase